MANNNNSNKNIEALIQAAGDFINEINEGEEVTDYPTKRRALNIMIFQALAGLEFRQGKSGKIKVKIHHQPTPAETNKVIELVSAVTTAEAKLNQILPIPGEQPIFNGVMTNKKILEKLFSSMIINSSITTDNLGTVLAVAKIVRKKIKANHITTAVLISVGCTAAVAAALLIVMKYNKKNKDNADDSDYDETIDDGIDELPDEVGTDEVVDLFTDVVVNL